MLPLDTSQIQKLFRDARTAEAAGKLDEAQGHYKTILIANPRHAPAHFQMGQIAYRQGRFDDALTHLDKAAEHRPQEKAIWQLSAKTLEQLGDRKRTTAFLARAKKAPLDRGFVVALQDALSGKPSKSSTSIGAAPPEKVQRAIDALRSGQAKRAAQLAGDLRRGYPKVALFADLLANAEAALGRADEAEKHFRAAVELDPNYAESHVNFGRFLVERGKYDAGIAQLKAALKIAPKQPQALTHMGVALQRSETSPERAAQYFRKALEIAPDTREALLELGRILMIERVHDEALTLLQRALTAGADEIDARLCIARVLAGLGREQDALAEIDKVLAIDPDCGPAYSSRASVLQTLGEFDRARADFRQAIELMPQNGETYRVALLTEKLKADDPIVRRMAELWEDPGLSDGDRRSLGFALAKAMEDTKQYDRVFTYLRPANDLVRKAYPYDIDQQRQVFAEIKRRFADVDFEASARAADAAFAPIFVTGLPRSGTTLVEQIVASHSQVEGGGELGFAQLEIDKVMRQKEAAGEGWNELTAAERRELTGRIETRMRAAVDTDVRMTDKSVQSYLSIGAIRALFPQARIVVVRRDPRDNLLSIYKNMFVEGKHLYSYNLRDLGQYFRIFEEIIGFWREKTPGWFHEIQYEALIADPETQAKALIAACGLDWEEQCLAFHENKRRVDTLSVHQVRQPLYASSMKAWERYGDELDELLDALGGEYAKA